MEVDGTRTKPKQLDATKRAQSERAREAEAEHKALGAVSSARWDRREHLGSAEPSNACKDMYCVLT